MIYRTQVIVCNTDKREELLMVLEKSLDAKPDGLGEMMFTPDATDDSTMLVYQEWDAKASLDAFEAGLSPGQAAFFTSMMASQVECWHNDPLTLPRS